MKLQGDSETAPDEDLVRELCAKFGLAIKPYLPADILARPNVSSPWKYEWKLAKGATLWGRPGRQKQTFEWGIRRLR